MIYMLLACLFLFVSELRADYDCICNYNVEKGVYSTASEQSQPIGYLYEFDCKPIVSQTAEGADWIVIACEHQTGYVSKNQQTRVQVCPGEIPSADKLTTASVTKTSHTAPAVGSTMKQHKPYTRTTSSPTLPVVNTTQSSVSTVLSTTPVQVISTTSPVTSTNLISSFSSSRTSDKFTFAVTTSKPSQTPGITSGVTLVCPNIVQQSALQEGGTLFINYNDSKCYEMVTTLHSWEYAEKDCIMKGGHLATIGDSMDEKLVYKYVKSYGHATWIGLHDMNNEESFEWASGEPVVYVNWHAGRKNIFLHGIEDCVAMGPLTGTWEDMDCLNRYAYVCEFDALNGSNDTLVQLSTPPQTGTYTDGNTMRCPSEVKSYALRGNSVLGQYGQSCYELIPQTRVSWEHGESMCRKHGGHLAYISTADEQGFMEYFMNRHSPQHAAWIGLHDKSVEGQFEWTSGHAVNYTNWVPGHSGNFESFRTEDCVAFIPYKNGQWDDIPCGNNNIIFGDVGETHPALCQYPLEASPIVG